MVKLCSFICPNVTLILDSHEFIVDLFVLPISGIDMILGVQWLKSLGPILTDYSQLTLKFVKEGNIIEIFSMPKSHPEAASLHQLRRLIATDSIDTYCQFQILHPTPPLSPNPHNNEALNTLLQQFKL